MENSTPRASVLGQLLDAIDDEDINRVLLRIQRETELFLEDAEIDGLAGTRVHAHLIRRREPELFVNRPSGLRSVEGGARIVVRAAPGENLRD